MRSVTVKFNAETAIELSFATVIDGKESQLFGAYFPKVIPIVAEFGGTPMGSFTIGKSASKLGAPKMGAFFQWPEPDSFQKLHEDPRFLAIKSIRDDALSFFCNANFFCVEEDTEVIFEEGQEYALVAEWGELENEAQSDFSSLVRLTPASGAANEGYRPAQIHIARWNENCEHALETAELSQNRTRDVFKFAMNMPA